MSDWIVSHVAGFNGPALFTKRDGKNIRLANFVEASEAEQRLAASAPTLLAAAKEIVRQYNSMPDGTLGRGFTNGPFLDLQDAVMQAEE